MTLRARLAAVAALAVAISVVLVATVSYLQVQDRLRDQLDDTLARTAARIANEGFVEEVFAGPVPLSPFRDEDQYLQLVQSDETVIRPANQRIRVPVNAKDLAVATGQQSSTIRDVNVNGTDLRLLTVPLESGLALQVARPLAEIEGPLDDLQTTLLFVTAGGVLIAIGLGLVVARAALRPVAHLTNAAEHVAQTQDLSATIDVHQSDELGRLATSFNAMLTALDASRLQQRQLVADASHELRTPLTSLRTNIEVLARQPRMRAAERHQLLDDVVAQLEELTTLVDDVVEIAREDVAGEGQFEAVDVELPELVEVAVAKANRYPSSPDFVVTRADDTVVRGNQALLERAVSNLLDNARKWSPPDGTVEVAVEGREVTVRDHGPGIAADDLQHVFDRFYRAPAARALPGSGLGLAIVRQVMQAHGGNATAESPEGGGTRLRLSFPDASSNSDQD